MKLRSTDGPKTRTVPIEDCEGCTLTVREPSFYELVEQYWEARTSSEPDATVDDQKLLDYRFRAIIDWTGFVDDDGKPIPFSQEWLRRAMRQSQDVLFAAVGAAQGSFRGISVAEEKNSETPPGDGSAAATSNTTAEEPTGG